MKLHAKNLSVGESGDEYFQVSFDCEPPFDDDFDPSVHDNHYLVVQRQFESPSQDFVMDYKAFAP